MEVHRGLKHNTSDEMEFDSPELVLQPIHADSPRPRVGGKFIFVGDEKFWVKGVSYGAFRPDEDGNEYWDKEKIERDFLQPGRSP